MEDISLGLGLGSPLSISVKFDSISKDEVNEVVKYYNENKLLENNNLQALDRAEGGFKININQCDDVHQSNDSIKQLRWGRGKILSSTVFEFSRYREYNDFTNDEKRLLYDALCSVFGEDKVSLFEKKPIKFY